MLENIICDLKRFRDYASFNKSIVMIKDFYYENEFVKVLRIDASNHWKGTPHYSEMDKQWGIIVDIKKPFTHLNNYKKLSSLIDISITNVTKGENKGKKGIRIYHMAQNPNKDIVKQILDYIFE